MKATRLKKILVRLLLIVAGLYIIGCSYMYFFQESFMFFPEKLEQSHTFKFDNEFEEMSFKTDDGETLSGMLFKAESSKGLIFYLHGNAGNIQTCGDAAKAYTDLGYDFFLMDYRGFGKSTGDIKNQDQLFSDVQLTYDAMTKNYPEKDIVVIGYSMGSGISAHLASENNPRKLILQAPYFSMVDMMQNDYPIVPTFLLNYKLETNEYLLNCDMPVVLFHGSKDEVIPYSHAVRLKKVKKGTKLIKLPGQEHNDLGENKKFLRRLPSVLNKGIH